MAAGELAARAPIAADLPSWQATAAAVTASQTIAAAAARVLAARVQGTGTKASIAASSYLESDEQSAQRLAEVTPVSVVV
jgi:hypothetical protein